MKKNFLLFTLFFACNLFSGNDKLGRCSDYTGPRTIIIPRSQGANTARELLGWQHNIFIYDKCNFYATYSAAFEYQHSFDNKELAKELFGTTQLSFVGSQVPNRQVNNNCSCNLIADYFGFSTLTNNLILDLTPKIENFIIDFNFFYGLNEWQEGLYFRIHLPLANSKWQLVQECIKTPAVNETAFPLCYMSTATVPVLTTFEDALSRGTFGDLKEGLVFAKFPFQARSVTRLADVDLILGYNIVQNECGHFGFYAQAVVPTGNKPKPDFVFSPIVGNGHFWEVGAGLTWHYTHDMECDQSFEIYFEGNMTHMFNHFQSRTFDLLNKDGSDHNFLSRYLLLKQFDPSNNYTGSLIHASQFTTRKLDTFRKLKGDGTIKFVYNLRNWSFDIGYNIYGHTKEEADCFKNLRLSTDSILAVINRNYGIKGNEGVCCEIFTISIDPITGERTVLAPTGSFGALNSTVSAATMCVPTTSLEVDAKQTTELINTTSTVCLTWNSTKSGTYLASQADGQSVNGLIVAQVSNPPTLLTDSDLNFASGLAPAMLTHKLFAYINYDWQEHRLCPFFGAGVSVEIAQNNKRLFGVSQYGILIKGGFTY